MKKLLAWLMALLLLTGCVPGLAEGEEKTPLSFAFGLFSVDVPAGSQAVTLPGNSLYMASYSDVPSGLRISANWAPLTEYGFAKAMLDSYISLQYALIGGEGYTETEI